MRGLPTVTVHGADAAWRAEARACVEGSGALLVADAPMGELPAPAGVVLHDNRFPAPQSAGVRLGVGVDPALPHDLPWPLPPAVLEGALRGAAAALAGRGLLSDPALAEAAFQRLVELSADSIEVVDRRVRLLYVNPAFEAVTGYALPEVLGRTTGEVFRAGTHAPAFYAEIMDVLSRGEPWRGQLVARRADGDLSYQESVLAPFHGPDGAPAGFVALKRDLARDALLARASAHAGDQRSALFEEIADAFLLHDEQGRVLDRNDSATRMFHLDERGEQAGLLVRVEPTDAARLLEAWSALRPGEPVAVDVAVHERAELAPRSVSLRSVRVRVAGEDLVLTIARDITTRVALERALTARSEELAEALAHLERASAMLVEREKQAALGGLVAGVAHELNTPLGVALTAVTIAEAGNAELDRLARTGAPTRRDLAQIAERGAESLRLVREQVQRAARLVADFKRLSVAETASSPSECDLTEQAQRVVLGMGPLLGEHGNPVAVEGPAVPIVADAAAFAQVLAQLLSNLASHAPGAAARVRVAPIPEGAEVVVEDDGPGLDAATAARAFEPFFTTGRGRGHVGLGLHVAHGLVVHRLGGDISIEPRPAGGARARFTLVDRALQSGSSNGPRS